MGFVKVAVTGASGFVGRHVALALAARGHDVVGFGRRRPDACTARLPSYRQWDIARDLADAPLVDAVVHCAAHVADWGDEARFHAVNMEGTRRVLAAFSGSRFVHVSTSSVYSDHVRTVRVREDASIGACAHSAYARSKAAAERLVLAVRPDAVVLRPHVVYGPGDTTLLPRLLHARRLGRLWLPGDGTSLLSVTCVGNLVLAVTSALMERSAAGVFNIADEAPIGVDALVRLALSRMQMASPIVHLPAPVARRIATALEATWRAAPLPGAPPLTRYVVKQLSAEHTLDTSRAREELGYVPRWSVHDIAFR